MTSCVRDPGDSLMLTSIACVALLGGFTTIVFAVETNIDPAARKAGADESWLQEVDPRRGPPKATRPAPSSAVRWQMREM